MDPEVDTDDLDDLDETESLEGEQTAADPAVRDGDTEAVISTETPETPANRWDAMKLAVERFGDGKDVRLENEPDDADDEEDEEAPDRATAEQPKPAKDTKEASAKPEQTDEAKAKQAHAAPAFTIHDADGDEAELEWPDGAKISFKADGREVEVTSFNDLVTFAQKGVHADRRLSQLGQERSQLATRAAELEQSLSAREAEVKQAEEILLKALFDKEARAKLRQELRPYRDPNVRAMSAAQAKLAAREAQDQQAKAAEGQQIAQQFGQKVDAEITEALADPEISYLTAEDAPAIKQQFVRNYQTLLAQVTQKFRGEAAAEGVTQAQADQEALRYALQYLTEDNLRALVKEFDSHYRDRATKGRGSAPERGPREPDPQAEAAAHNARVKAKLDQRNRPRPIRGGAPPAGGSDELPGEGLTFEQRMNAMRRELRKARSG